MSESDILIVGAGAKAAAIAAKVHAINTLGLGEISMTVIEKTEPAASWLGRNGMTSGEEPLAIPPIKDIGFPYQSSLQFGGVGDEIDAALLPLSWQRFAMERHEYAAWVNSGSPSVLHKDYGEYLGWVLERATEGVSIYDGRVTEVSLSEDHDRWQVEVAERRGLEDPERHSGRALVLTGPGAISGSAGMLGQLQGADRIKQMFFRSGNLPEVDFTWLTPVLDAGIGKLVIDVDGQKYEYQPGGATNVSMKWPGPQPGRVSISAYDTAGNLLTTFDYRGDWAFFRALQAANLQKQSDLRFVASFNFGGHVAKVTLQANNLKNPFLSNALSSFRCGG